MQETDMIATVSAAVVAERIRDALISSPLGRRPDAITMIAEAANTNRRSVKNWIAGLNAPNAASFVNLARRIPEVRQAALHLIHATPDPAFDANMIEAAQRWLIWHARRTRSE